LQCCATAIEIAIRLLIHVVAAATTMKCYQSHTQLLGTPTESSSGNIWPGVTRLPYWQADVFPTWPKLSLKHALSPSSLSTAGLNLLQQLLTYEPAKRITAKQALQHQYTYTSETETTAAQSFDVGTTEQDTVASTGKL
jgi:serine/threonine protein kinase